ncbi:DUF4123 domain-containing protein [Cupriavidus sp. DL-D2]|uniref:DUF4123 domain-containing protein n=1 Tax=Cupriavidus sp. DL-D2 TaxID=3144974 RepID=UPI003213023B
MEKIPPPHMPETLPLPSARFAVIDAAQLAPEHWDDLPSRRMVPDAYRDRAELFPILVDLDELDETQRVAVLDRDANCAAQSGKTYLMALLDARGTPASVLTHLTRRMLVRRPDGQEDILRIYDPLVFRHLRWLLSVEQIDSLLGPIGTWHWREPDGTWHSHSRDADQPSIRPLRLTPAQWPSLLRMADLQRAIRTLADDDAPCAWRIETAQQLDQLLADTESIEGLNESEDRALHALQALRFGRTIHQHSALLHRLGMARNGETTYSSACADLDAIRLQKFADELQQSH